MKSLRFLLIALLPAFMIGCSQGGINKQQGGTTIGAIAGGILGNQVGKGGGKVVATAIGAVIGGIVGSELGRSLDAADRRAAQEAEFRALEYGQSGVGVPWKNPDSGHHGTVVAGKPYSLRNSNCREYTHTIYISGEPQTLRGTACRQPDGTWRNIT